MVFLIDNLEITLCTDQYDNRLVDFIYFSPPNFKRMYTNTLTIVAICLILLLLFNIYLRMVVFKAYNKLVRNKVDFTPKQMMNKQLLESEVIPKYPDFEDDIRSFSQKINISIYVGIVMLAIILFLGWTLIRNS